ncbi:MAG: TusE/DsrC/DsvC family sulfur relay protein [Desulforhopalus sp.]|jgi:TusE/DsrC/DsvC family sulfur relay protein
MTELSCCGKKITLDEAGFMTDPGMWDDCVAQSIAEKEGIETISDEQKAIIRFMRSYYDKHTNWPILHNVCKQVQQSSRCVFNEFDNPEKAWKIAGLPKFDGVHFVKLDGERYIMEDYC